MLTRLLLAVELLNQQQQAGQAKYQQSQQLAYQTQ
jgi:hypothetical protein